MPVGAVFRSTAIVALAAATAFAGSAAAGLSSGISGRVWIGPTTPVCIVGKPCSRAAAGVELDFYRNGRRRGHVVSGRRGGFRLLLRPGSYTVRAILAGRPRPVSPSKITIGRGRLLRRSFLVDTGIR